jgi:hypothetical protein
MGAVLSAVVNVFTGDEAKTWEFIVARMTDPHRPLFYFELIVIVSMLLFWFGEWGISSYCNRRRWEVQLAQLARRRTGPAIALFSSSVITWGENLTLQLCPDFRGWAIDTIELRWIRGGHSFVLPSHDQRQYDTFRENNKTQRWYLNDGASKVRLTKNPISFTDSPELILEVQRCKYSEIQYTNRVLATNHNRRQECLQAVVAGDIPFANTFVIHAVIITSDELILATLSSNKKDFFGGCWSFSIEEQLRPDDLAGSDVHNRVLVWMKRSLLEELGVSDPDYAVENLRVLSVFIEGHNLNCGLCCVVSLSIPSATLGAIISAIPRPDTEFTEHKFFPIKDAIELLRVPNIPLHPTSEYRLFLALCYLLDPPRLAGKLFRQETP